MGDYIRQIMPNWCENRLDITGDKTQLAKLKKDAVLKYKKVGKGEDEFNYFSIGKLIPLPEELRKTVSPTTIVSEKDYKKEVEKAEADYKKRPKAYRDEMPLTLPITKKMSDELIKKYGHDNWYAWQNSHWGTKWDTRTTSMNKDTEKRLDYDMDTAWSPPISAIHAISKLYPKLTFKLKYCEPSMCFSGDYHVKNGRVSMNNQLDEVWDEYQCHHDELKKGEECDVCCDFVKQ